MLTVTAIAPSSAQQSSSMQCSLLPHSQCCVSCCLYSFICRHVDSSPEPSTCCNWHSPLVAIIYYGISCEVKSQNNIVNIVSVLLAAWSGVLYTAGGKRYLIFKTQDHLRDHPATYLKVSGIPLLEVKQPECEADNSLPFSAEIKNDWCQVSSLLICLSWHVGIAVPLSYDGIVQGKLALRLGSISWKHVWTAPGHWLEESHLVHTMVIFFLQGKAAFWLWIMGRPQSEYRFGVKEKICVLARNLF